MLLLRSSVLFSTLLLVSGAEPAPDGSFTRDGVELHYRTAGTGAPVIILSGGPGLEVDYMAPAAEFLPDSCQRVLFEQRGTGRSKVEVTPETMTIANVVADLEGLRVALNQERLVLLGHSWGGMLAMAYAAAHPDRVDRLILVGSGGPTLEFQDWFGDNIEARMRPEDREASRYWTEAGKRGVDADKAALENVRAMTPAYFFDRAKGLEVAAAFPDGGFHALVNELLFADLEKHYDCRPGLAKLARPVLIIQGHQDPIGDKTAEQIHAAIAGSELKYLRKCGHFPWVEQPDEFRAAIVEFLAK